MPYQKNSLGLPGGQNKLDISTTISDDPDEHCRFNSKVPQKRDILSRLHHILVTSPLDFNRYILQFVKSSDTTQSYTNKPPTDIRQETFLMRILSVLGKMGESNRLRFLSHIKYANDNMKEMLLIKKIEDWGKLEEAKQKILDQEI